MPRQRLTLSLLLPLLTLLVLSGCAVNSGQSGQTMRAPFAVGPFPAYRTTPIQASTRIFLIAGGSSLANFLQEVVDQRDHWLSVGYRSNQIACYYVHPNLEDYLEDKAQFDALAPAARGFYEADPDLLATHFRAVGASSPREVYVYSTSHGVEPSAEIPVYALLYDRDPQRPESSFTTIDAAFLRDALHAFPASTSKWVVLQACHAGGLVNPGPGGPQAASLTLVPNIRVFAASRHDRPSFGCSASADYTYYGLAFLESLREQRSKLSSVDDQLLNATVVHRIKEMETNFRIPTSKQSEPFLYSNTRN